MILYYENCNLEIQLTKGNMYGICIESPKVLRDFVYNLYLQSKGQEGEIFLTDRGNRIRFDKEVSVVFNPFSVDVNEKRIITKLYAEMVDIAGQDWYVRLQEINTQIVELLEDVSLTIPYPIDYSYDVDFSKLLKAYAVKIDDQETGLADRVINYIKLAHQILEMKMFVLVHFKDYFSVDDIVRIQETLMYEEVVVLLIESSIEKITGLKWWIIDNDSCIIEV